MENNTTYHPIQLYQADDNFVVFLDVGEYIEHEALFEKYETSSCGYGWAGVMYTLLEEEHSGLIPSLDFDPNLDEFWVAASTKEAQQVLGKILFDLINNSAKLEEILKCLPEDRKEY